MSNDRDIRNDGNPDQLEESMAALARAQLQCLGDLRVAATNMALAVETRRQTRRDDEIPETSFTRLGKLVLQICAMEQHTIALWQKSQRTLHTNRTERGKKEVRQKVEAAVEAATPPGPVRMRQMGQLRGLIPRYDFSTPAKMRAAAEEMCRALGVPFPADAFPEEDLEAAAARRLAEVRARMAAQGVKPLLDPETGADVVPDPPPEPANTEEEPAGAAPITRPDRYSEDRQPDSLDQDDVDFAELSPLPLRRSGRGPP
jgi:hypothetical protein